MSQPLRIDTDAEAEFQASAIWYEKQLEGLGQDFIAAVNTAICEIQDNPMGYPIAPNIPDELGVRKHFVKRFPYTIFYMAMNNEIHILAVAHGHRRPGYWQQRIEED
jgi:plasmid stabilization system protein ParE